MWKLQRTFFAQSRGGAEPQGFGAISEHGDAATPLTGAWHKRLHNIFRLPGCSLRGADLATPRRGLSGRGCALRTFLYFSYFHKWIIICRGAAWA